MGRVNPARLSGQEQTALRGELLRAIRALRKEDVGRFISDLLTPGEVLMLGRRIRVAKALLTGKTYEAIAHEQKASFSTIQLVDRAIQRGLEGYRRVLQHAERQAHRRRRKGTLPNETIEMLRRLPGSGYFRLWLDLLDDGEEK